MMTELTYENIVHNLGVKIQAIQNEIQRLRDTKGLGMDKLGRILSLEIDLQYNQMLNKACEKQVPKKPRKDSRRIIVGIDGANCETCGKVIFNPQKHCSGCGNKLDWKQGE